MERAGLTGPYESWAFGDAPDKLVALVKNGVKTATCLSYDLYQAEGEPIPKTGDYSVILDDISYELFYIDRIIDMTRIGIACFIGLRQLIVDAGGCYIPHYHFANLRII